MVSDWRVVTQRVGQESVFRMLDAVRTVVAVTGSTTTDAIEAVRRECDRLDVGTIELFLGTAASDEERCRLRDMFAKGDEAGAVRWCTVRTGHSTELCALLSWALAVDPSLLAAWSARDDHETMDLYCQLTGSAWPEAITAMARQEVPQHRLHALAESHEVQAIRLLRAVTPGLSIHEATRRVQVETWSDTR